MSELSDCKPQLIQNENGLTLSNGELTIRGDFLRMLPRITESNLHRELLIRAAKLKNFDSMPLVVDATAGLGEDSFLLAAAGCNVKLFERDKTIYLLLKDALCRAQRSPELSEIALKMHLCDGDSIIELPHISPSPDIVYLDPMFPKRQKSSLVKKKFQLLHYLEQPCSDENELLQAAISANPKKIIIKRPSKAPHLAEKKPSYSIEGKGIRYDCIVL